MDNNLDEQIKTILGSLFDSVELLTQGRNAQIEIDPQEISLILLLLESDFVNNDELEDQLYKLLLTIRYSGLHDSIQGGFFIQVNKEELGYELSRAKPISQNLSWLELFLDAAVKFNNGEFAYVAHLLIEQLSLAFEPENTIHKSTDIWSSVLAQRFISADFLNSNKLSVLEQKFLHARYQFSEENNSHLKLLKSEPLPIAAKKAEIEFKQAVVLDELVRQCLLSEATICDDERDDNVYSASEEQFQLRLKYLRLLLVYGRRFNREEFLCVAKENILLYLQEPQPFKVASNSLEVSVGIITLLSEFLAFEDNHKAFQSIIEICDNDSIGDIKVDSADIGNKTSTHGLIKCFWYLQILACLKKKRADESFSTLGEKKLGELIENRLSKKGSLPATVLLKQNVGMWLLNGTITATLPLQEKCFRGYQPFRLSHYTSSLTSEIEFETGENVVLTIVNSLGDERSFTSVSDAL